MFDFGSILGSGTVYAQRHRAGNEYIFEKPGWLTLATLGLYMRPWMHIDYPDVAAVGRTARGRGLRPARVEAGVSERRRSTTCGPTMRSGRRASSRGSRDAMIRAVVEKARYSDPRATDYMTQTLIKRRDKVVRRTSTRSVPVVDPTLAPDGALSFANAAVDAGAATAPSQYTLAMVCLRQRRGYTSRCRGAGRDADHGRAGSARGPDRRRVHRGSDLGHTP